MSVGSTGGIRVGAFTAVWAVPAGRLPLFGKQAVSVRFDTRGLNVHRIARPEW